MTLCLRDIIVDKRMAISRSADLGNNGAGVGCWHIILQGVQVYPDLRPGLLQLHAGGLGSRQAQSCYQAIDCVRVSNKVGKHSGYCSELILATV